MSKNAQQYMELTLKCLMRFYNPTFSFTKPDFKLCFAVHTLKRTKSTTSNNLTGFLQYKYHRMFVALILHFIGLYSSEWS